MTGGDTGEAFGFGGSEFCTGLTMGGDAGEAFGFGGSAFCNGLLTGLGKGSTVTGAGGGGGGGGARVVCSGTPPVGNTGTAIWGCMAARAEGGRGPCGEDCTKGDVLELVACGWSLTPSAFAFLVIRRCIRGLRICDRSSPPGVYVNGFLSLVIIAFCIAAGGSYTVPPLVSGISVLSRTVGKRPGAGAGGGGGGGAGNDGAALLLSVTPSETVSLGGPGLGVLPPPDSWLD